MVICNGWHSLHEGQFKCNVDFAFFENLQQYYLQVLDAILLNEESEFVAARALCKLGCICVDEGEAMGFHEALSQTKNVGYARVIFEMDNKRTVDAIKFDLIDRLEFGGIIECCKIILREKILPLVSFLLNLKPILWLICQLEHLEIFRYRDLPLPYICLE